MELDLSKLKKKNIGSSFLGTFKETHYKPSGKKKGEHIPNWEMKGLYLGIRVGAIEDGNKKKDMLYFYDLDEKEIKIITVPIITGKIKYAIASGSIKLYDLIIAKYFGKKLGPSGFEYNDYQVDIYECPEDLLNQEEEFDIGGEIQKMSIREYIQSQVTSGYWDMFADEEAALSDMNKLYPSEERF